MLLIQGVMSAISAGMLIYAATVEMIAGDFVFGDVDGGHHHHHQHHEPPADESSQVPGHNHPLHWANETGMQKRGRPHRNGDPGEDGDRDSQSLPLLLAEAGDDHSTSRTKQTSMAKRVLAIVS